MIQCNKPLTIYEDDITSLREVIGNLTDKATWAYLELEHQHRGTIMVDDYELARSQIDDWWLQADKILDDAEGK